MTPEQQAAWLQAIGSIAAVTAALIVPMAERRARKADAVAERQVRAASAAIELLPEIRRWRRDIERAVDVIDAETTAGTAHLANSVFGMRSATPKPSSRGRFALFSSLGSVGIELSAIFLTAIEINDDKEKLDAAITNRTIDDDEDVLKRCEVHLDRLRVLILDLKRIIKTLGHIALHGIVPPAS